jgi:hypothetical protein
MPATWKAEAGGSQVQDQPVQFRETLSQNKIKRALEFIYLHVHLPEAFSQKPY